VRAGLSATLAGTSEEKAKMKVEFDCWYCKKHIEAEAIPIEPDHRYYGIDMDCPYCGGELETVIKEK
jgi:hypothetical protein